MSENERNDPAGDGATPRGKPAWVGALKEYEKPSVRKVTIQLLDTVLPYLALLVLMDLTIRWRLPYVVTLALAVPASALLVRIFIFFHDCVHGSYVASPRGLSVLGNLFGILVFTPFGAWRYSHGMHHTTSGNLDRRGIGDVWTMTMDEFAASSPLRRLAYRLFRNPFIMFGLGPFFMFILVNRIPARGVKRAQVLSTLLVDVALAAVVVACGLTIGFRQYVMIQLPIMLIGGAGGVWLFYVQHQFDPSYWARTEEWNSMEAAMQGSSYYKLPRVLQWISGNIGLHHIHHLRPRIPNYNLQKALDETPHLQLPHPLRLGPSLRSVRLKLWDEKERVFLTFAQGTRRLRGPAQA